MCDRVEFRFCFYSKYQITQLKICEKKRKKKREKNVCHVPHADSGDVDTQHWIRTRSSLDVVLFAYNNRITICLIRPSDFALR